MELNHYYSSNFQHEVLESKMPVLIDFWAPWCRPCKRLEPIMEEIATELDGKVEVGKIDISENQELANQYRIMSIPAICLFKNGKLLSRLTGFRPKNKIINEIKRYISI
jgi:thioredoxin 1